MTPQSQSLSFDEVFFTEDSVVMADGFAAMAKIITRDKVKRDHGLDGQELDLEEATVIEAEALAQAIERLEAGGEAMESAAQSIALELNRDGLYHAVGEADAFSEALQHVYVNAGRRGAEYYPRMVEVIPKLAANAGVQPVDLIRPDVKSKAEEAVGAYNSHNGEVPPEVQKEWVEKILDSGTSKREFLGYLRQAGWRAPRIQLLKGRVNHRKETTFFVIRCDSDREYERIEGCLAPYVQFDPTNRAGLAKFLGLKNDQETHQTH